MAYWVGGVGLTNSFALLGLLSLVAVQFWISRALLRQSGRLQGKTGQAARAGIWSLTLLAPACYLFIIPAIGSASAPLGSLPGALGAAALCYLIVAAVVIPVNSIARSIRGRLDETADPGRRRLLQAVSGLAMTAPAVALGYGAFVQRTDFRIREIDLPMPGLPADLDGLRIAHLSDIHLGAFLSRSELSRVIDAASELRSNIAVVTGDLISVMGDPIDDCIKQISAIRCDTGVFACMGNHERYAHAEDYVTREAAKSGVSFLRRKTRRLRFGSASLSLAGVDHQSISEPAAYLRGAEGLLAPGAFNVLLSHNPDVFPVAARQGWDLMLSGHTHGGQLAVEILDQSICPARLVTPYVYGLYRRGASAAYVTRGIGSIGIPVRLGAPPEIALLRLRKA